MILWSSVSTDGKGSHKATGMQLHKRRQPQSAAVCLLAGPQGSWTLQQTPCTLLSSDRLEHSLIIKHIFAWLCSSRISFQPSLQSCASEITLKTGLWEKLFKCLKRQSGNKNMNVHLVLFLVTSPFVSVLCLESYQAPFCTTPASAQGFLTYFCCVMWEQKWQPQSLPSQLSKHAHDNLWKKMLLFICL